LRHDPAVRWIVGGMAAHASPSQMGRFETRWLAAPKEREPNPTASKSKAFGNGHFGCT